MWRAALMSVLALVSFLAAGEIVFRVLPVSTATKTGFYLDPLIRSYPPRHAWTAATGWDLRNAQRVVANNAGFVSDRDFVADEHAVALIGDSYVESSMLAANDRLGAQLQRALGPGRQVYAMGSPGTSLLDYAERVRLAKQSWGVRTFVLLVEAGDLVQALCNSGNVDGPCLDPQTLSLRQVHHPPSSWAKEVARHSALAQYVFSQLKFDASRLWRQAVQQSQPAQGHKVGNAAIAAKAPAAAAAAAADLRMVAAVTHHFFDRVGSDVARGLVVVLDGERGGADRHPAERQRFIELILAAGAQVVDADPIFRAHLASSALKLEVGTNDRHLNPLGLSLIAAPVATLLAGH